MLNNNVRVTYVTLLEEQEILTEKIKSIDRERKNVSNKISRLRDSCSHSNTTRSREGSFDYSERVEICNDCGKYV